MCGTGVRYVAMESGVRRGGKGSHVCDGSFGAESDGMHGALRSAAWGGCEPVTAQTLHAVHSRLQ